MREPRTSREHRQNVEGYLVALSLPKKDPASKGAGFLLSQDLVILQRCNIAHLFLAGVCNITNYKLYYKFLSYRVTLQIVPLCN